MRLLIDTLECRVGGRCEERGAREVERRIAELDSGAVEAVPWEELRARLYQR